jgi:hypothetical protein
MVHSCGNATRHTERIGCCSGCRHLFSSDSAFDRHRRGGECLDVETATHKGERIFVGRPSRTAPGETVWALARTSEFIREKAAA